MSDENEENEPATGIYPSPEMRALLLAKLGELGDVEVSFSGGGDSGSVDGIYVGSHALDKKKTIPWPEKLSTHTDSLGWRELTVLKERPIYDVLEELTYMALDEQGLDWYNNDGGSGTLEITFPEDGKPVVTLKTAIRVIEYEHYEKEL